MVKFSFASLAAAAAGLVSFATADNCTPGLDYCGHVLLDIGNYYSQISNALSAEGESTSPTHIQQSLFHCTGGSNGEIEFLEFCSGGCQDAGSGNSDSC